jgi:hypothetical protein
LYFTTLSVVVKNQIPKCFNFKQLKQSATINVYDLPQQRHHLVILRKIANTLMTDEMTFYFSLCRISHLATAEKVNWPVSSLTLNWGYKRDNFDTKSKNIQKVSSFYFIFKTNFCTKFVSIAGGYRVPLLTCADRGGSSISRDHIIQPTVANPKGIVICKKKRV